MTIDELVKESWEHSRYEQILEMGWEPLLNELQRLRAENTQLRITLGVAL